MTIEEYKKEMDKARTRLKQYNARCAAIANLPGEIRLLELKSSSIRSATTDGEPIHGGGNRREEILAANIDRRAELQRNLERAQIEVDNADRAMSTLTAEQQHILQVMHVNRQRGAAERLRREMGLDDVRSVYKMEAGIIERFLLALNGTVKPTHKVKVRTVTEGK